MKNFVYIFLFFYSLSLQASNFNIETQDPIKITINNWHSQIVISHAVKKIFAAIGYNVELIQQTNTKKQFKNIAKGFSHIQLEVWEGTMSTYFNQYVNEGSLLDAGTHSAITREEWWYPNYVAEQCDGLPDWQSLNKCAKLFAEKNGQDIDSGVYYAGPWEKPDLARVRALSMDFIIKKVKTEQELWDRLSAAFALKKPIVLFNWTPNWTESVYQGKFVEFPEYSLECEKDPAWGINKTFLFDCGNPKSGWLKKAAWVNMPGKWPCAYNILEKIDLSNIMLADAAFYVQYEKLSYEQAADKWLNKYQSDWIKWLENKNCPKLDIAVPNNI